MVLRDNVCKSIPASEVLWEGEERMEGNITRENREEGLQ